MTNNQRAKNNILLEMIYDLEIKRNKLIALKDRGLFLYSQDKDMIYLQQYNKIIVELQNRQYKIINAKYKGK